MSTVNFLYIKKYMGIYNSLTNHPDNAMPLQTTLSTHSRLFLPGLIK